MGPLCPKVNRMEGETATFATDHIYLGAFLICCGHRIVGTSSVSNRTSFLFYQTPQLTSDVAAFMAGAAVPARQFSFEILKLKRQLPRPGQTVKKVAVDVADVQKNFRKAIRTCV